MRCLPKNIYELPSTTIQNIKTFVNFEDFFRQLFYDFYAGRYIYIIVIVVSIGMHCIFLFY